MSLSVELKPDMEGALRREAELRGLAPEQLARDWIEDRISALPGEKPNHEEWVRRTREWSERHRDWPLLPDEAYERESLYPDRW
jgi:hypothetical protein